MSTSLGPDRSIDEVHSVATPVVHFAVVPSTVGA
jgi:hypothetical protein